MIAAARKTAVQPATTAERERFDLAPKSEANQFHRMGERIELADGREPWAPLLHSPGDEIVGGRGYRRSRLSRANAQFEARRP